MTKNTLTNVVCATVALFATTLTFAEVTSVQSVDFEYDEAKEVAYEA